MADPWITSWYWSWRGVGTPPPSAPQVLPDARAQQLGRLMDLALACDQDESPTPLLALACTRLRSQAEARVEYRVSPRVRFTDPSTTEGPNRRAWDEVNRRDSAGELVPTRGPFYLSEILGQRGLAAITLRVDILLGEATPRTSVYVPIAITHGGGPLEPMEIVLFDPSDRRTLWLGDELLTRAWHAPHAGGEILALLPSSGVYMRSRSGAIQSVRTSTDAPTTRTRTGRH